MTVSMFDTYLERMSLHRAERMMDASQASIYAQLTNQSRKNLWTNWEHVVNKVNFNMIHSDAANAGQNPITWNGRTMSIRGLINKFKETFGKKGIEKT
jgi:hypothetical protein